MTVQRYLCSTTICATKSCYPESAGNHSKTARMWPPKLFSLLSWRLTPVQPHVGGVSVVNISAPTHPTHSSVGDGKVLVRAGQGHSRELSKSPTTIWGTSEDIWASVHGPWTGWPAQGWLFLEGWGFSFLPHPCSRPQERGGICPPGWLNKICSAPEGACLTTFGKYHRFSAS